MGEPRHVDRLELAVRRELTRLDRVEPDDRVALLVALIPRLERDIDDAARQLLEAGATYAELARLLDITRQAARKRYAAGPPPDVDQAGSPR